MYYNTPDLRSYVLFVKKHRVAILLFFFFLAAVVLDIYRPKLLTSEAMFWLKESKEFQKETRGHINDFSLIKLEVDIPKFDTKTKEELQKLQKELEAFDGVVNVSSLFSKLVVQKERKKSSSSMVGIVSIGDLDALSIKSYVKKLNNPYENFVNKDFTHFTYYILAKGEIDLNSLQTPLQYKIKSAHKAVEWENYLLYGGIAFVLVALLFFAIFSNFVSSVGALVLVSLTTLFTFALIGYIHQSSELYVAMPFISLSIATVDYLYFYFRWHVSQYKMDSDRALVKMLDRNIIPAFWTTFLTVVGLGGLLFFDLEVVRLLALSVILSSVFAYLLNLTLLPAFLSFFKASRPNVAYDRVCYYLSVVETRYSKKLLLLFLAVSFVISLVGIYEVYKEKYEMFKTSSDVEQVVIDVPYKKIDLAFIQKLHKLREDLFASFEEGIDEIDSLDAIVMELDQANAQTKKLDEQALAQALFYLDLYGLSGRYFDQNGVKIVLHIDDMDTKRLVEWLMHYKGVDIHVLDESLRLDTKLYKQKLLLALSLGIVLFVIGAVAGFIFRSYLMAFAAFAVNAAPIVWFGFLLYLFGFHLSLELLIAMTIALGLASDATIHLAFKYFRSRYFGRSIRRSLQKMFFYSGMPVILGSLVLVAFFAFLIVFKVESLQLIGVFTALLIVVFMLSNLLILPVLLQFIDRFDKKRR